MTSPFARTQFLSMEFARLFRVVALLAFALMLTAPSSQAAEDTTRFYGTWQAQVLVNGQTLTLISVHDSSGFTNFVRSSSGDTPAGAGTFSAANGRYTTNAPSPNNGGVYRFMGNDAVMCTNMAGQTAVWRRVKVANAQGPVDANVAARNVTGYIPPSTRPGTERLNPGGPPESGPVDVPQTSSGGSGFKSDPSLAPEVNAGLAAMNRKETTPRGAALWLQRNAAILTASLDWEQCSSTT